MAKLYKDHECTIPAICPMSFGNRFQNLPLTCITECAWCRVHRCKREDYIEKWGHASCFLSEGTSNIPLYAKEESE